jgi:hypothetical protein
MRKLSIWVISTAALLMPTIASAQGRLPSGLGRGNQNSNTYHRKYVIYLSGKVVKEDGTPPDRLVTMERVCNGQVFPEGYTDSKGAFNVQVGGTSVAALEDASTYGTDARGGQMGDPLSSGGISGSSERFSTMRNMGSVDLTGCELRAQLDGYRTDSYILGKRSIYDRPEIGTFILHPLEGVSGVTVSATSLAAPKNARKAYEKGFALWNKSEPAKAAKELGKAVAAHPPYAEAWNLLGKTRLMLNDEPAARAAFTKAIEADGNYLPPYALMAELSVRAGDWPAALHYSEDLLKLNPHDAQARFFQALAAYESDDLDTADSAIGAVLSDEGITRQVPQAFHLAGLIHTKQAQFEEAASAYRQYLAAAPQAPNAGEVRSQLNEWEVLGVIKPQPPANANPGEPTANP